MPKKNIMRSFKLAEISAVDRPAQTHARATIIKREEGMPLSDAIAKRYIDPADGAYQFSDVLQNSMDYSRYCEVMEVAGPTINALDTAARSIIADNTIDANTKQTLLRNAVEDFLAAVRATWPDIEMALNKVFVADGGEDDVVSKGDHGTMDADTKKQVDALTAQITTLTKQLEAATGKNPDAKKVADLTGQVETLTKQIADLTSKAESQAAELADAVAKAGMSDKEKAYHDKLKSDDEKKKFRGAKAEERKAMMTKAEENDEIIKIEGREIRKSAVGDDQFAIFKAQAARIDAAEADVRKERELRETTELTKRAEEELGAFAGEAAPKLSLMRAIAKMSKEDQGTLKTMLDAGGKAIKAAFETLGHGDGKGITKAQDNGAFEKRVSEIASRDKITKVEAMQKARQEYPEEFKAYQGLQ